MRVETGEGLLRARKIPPPSVVKIDVEGAEADVLVGCGEVLRDRSLRLLLVEVHPCLSGSPPGTVERYLSTMGLTCRELARRNQEYWCLATRRPAGLRA